VGESIVTATVTLSGSLQGGLTGSVSGRISEWLKREGSAKEIGRLVGASPRTVEAWHEEDGHPGFGHLCRMVDVWGAAFLDYVFAPALAESDASLDRRLANVALQISVIRAELNDEDSAACGDARDQSDTRAGNGALAHRAGRKSRRVGKVVAALFFVAFALMGQFSGYAAAAEDVQDEWRTMRSSRSVRNGLRAGARAGGRGVKGREI